MAPQPTNPGQSPKPSQNHNIQLPQNFTAPPSSPSTKPAQKTSAQPPKTWQAPRLHPGEPISEQEKSPIFDDFRKPLKRVGLAIAMLFITGLLISLIVNAIAGLLRGTPPPSQVSMPVAASPKVLPGKEVAKDNADRNACTDIPTKMKAAQISSKQVDRVFWQKHPDRANKTLDLSSATDRTLRQEWCQIAGDLAAPKP
jgi:hypothetical protein